MYLGRYFSRFKQAIRKHPEILQFVENLANWFDAWADAVSGQQVTFEDPITSSLPPVRNLTISQLRDDILRLRTIVRRESGVADQLRRPTKKSTVNDAHRREALLNRLAQTYDPPGVLREGGIPRHNNDFANISDIRIAPTQEELLCPLDPYLPKFIPGAPHHSPQSSMERHLDIQFRLLREELM